MRAGTAAAHAAAWLRRRAFWLLLGLFVLLRLVQGLGLEISIDEEEGFNMASAWELVTNPGRWPYQGHQISDYENGSLVTVLLLALLSLALGPTLLCLKVAALAHGALSLGALWLLCSEAAGRSAAILACLAFVLFPGPLLHSTLTAHGFHPDSVGLQLLFLWLVLRGLGPGLAEGRRRRLALLAGLVGGFAVYYAYISALAVAAGGALLLWSAARALGGRGRRGWRAVGAQIALVGLGGAAGAAPFFAYNLANDWMGLQVYGDRSAAGFFVPDTASIWTHVNERIVDVALRLSNYFQPEDPWLPLFNRYFWLLALACALLPPAAGLLRRLRRRAAPGRRPTAGSLAAVVLLFVLLTAYMFFSSGHELMPWHYVPLVVVLLAGVGGALGALWDSGSTWRRGLALALLLPLLACGVRANLTLVEPRQLGLAASVDGRDLPFFYKRVIMAQERGEDHPVILHTQRHWLALPLEQAKAEQVNLSFRTDQLAHKVHFAAFYGDHWLYFVSRDTSAQGWVRFFGEPFPPALRVRQAQTAGYTLAFMLRSPDRVQGGLTPQQLPGLLRRAPPGRLGDVYEGFGFGSLPRELADPAQARALARGAGAARWPALSRRLYRGLGRSLRLTQLLLAGPDFCARKIPSRMRAAYVEGVGAGLGCRMMWGEVPGWLLQDTCPALRPHLRRGIQQGLSFCQTRPEQHLRR